METRVTDAMNSILTQTITREEVEMALKHMDPMKFPRLDGFGACFFQKY